MPFFLPKSILPLVFLGSVFSTTPLHAAGPAHHSEKPKALPSGLTCKLPTQDPCQGIENGVALIRYDGTSTGCIPTLQQPNLFSPEVIASLSKVLHPNDNRPAESKIDARLLHFLYQMGTHYRSPLCVVSALRSQQAATQKGNSKSAHVVGRACDFQVVHQKTNDVFDYIRKEYTQEENAYKALGVVNTPNHNPDFVHVEIREDRYFFAKVDVSENDQLSVYQPVPEERTSEKAIPPKPTAPKPATKKPNLKKPSAKRTTSKNPGKKKTGNKRL